MSLMHVLVLVATVCLCVSANPSIIPNKRLIAFNETDHVWLDEAEIEKLSVNKVNFMDITDFQDVHLALPNADPFPNQPIHKILVGEVIKGLSSANLKKNLEQLVTYNTRYYKSDTGVAAANWIFDQMKAVAGDRSDITVELFPHTFPQPSVIATIAGNGPNKDQIVIIGGHEDSIGSSSTGRSPGADDDGTGTVSVMEVFRVIAGATYKNDRTLQFITYAAEEAGLLGSQAIAAKYVSNKKLVHAVLQLDMTGYGSLDNVGVVGDYVDNGLSSYVKILIDSYTSLGWIDTKCGYGCSDHASWTRNGYRASFVFETDFPKSNPYIHSASDLISHISFPRMLEFTKLAVAFLIELGDITVEL